MGLRRRHLTKVALIVALGVVALVPLGGNAIAAQRQQWTGVSAQDAPLRFFVVSTSQGYFISSFELSGLLTCEVSGNQIFLDAFFGGVRMKVDNGQFRFDEVSSDIAVHWSGSISANSAAGLLRLTLPALTPNEDAEVCTTDNQTWTAKPGSGTSGTGPRAGVSVVYTRHTDGSVTRTEQRT